ncbi:MAG: DUF4890 domain-containing protein [Bacteroides sp.]
MKKIGFLMIALLCSGSMVMAQGTRRGDRPADPKVRAECMTERMVKEYALNEAQQKQLLEVNQAWVEKTGTRRQGTKQGIRRDKRNRNCPLNDTCCITGQKKRAEVSPESREQRRLERTAAREAYDAQLQKILTKSQYEAYAKKRAGRK